MDAARRMDGFEPGIGERGMPARDMPEGTMKCKGN
jgi:hypothetical protein